MVKTDLSIGFVPGGCDHAEPPTAKKKPTWCNTFTVWHHVGVLVDEPPGAAGLPFS
jgi:hypothetical protein